MGKGLGMKQKQAAGTAPVRFENPLMPDERLRQMYTAMVQMRMLEEHLLAGKADGKRPAKRKPIDVIRGEEAVRASTALSLSEGDMIGDGSAAPVLDLLLGAKLASVAGSSGKADPRPVLPEGSALRLPVVDARERLTMSLGAAAAMKAQKSGRVLLVYVGAGEAKKKDWKGALSAAGKQELPMIFVVLPAADEKDTEDAGKLCARSRAWGVPGFPVDGVDAIGLYRVMQESLLRARNGNGPALIECVPFHLGGKQQREDPIERLGELLLLKGVADAEWMKRTRSAFSVQLARLKR